MSPRIGASYIAGLAGLIGTAGTAAVATHAGANKVGDFFTRHSAKKQAKRASKLGLSVEQLPKRPIRKLFAVSTKATAKVVAVGTSALASMVLAGGVLRKYFPDIAKQVFK